MCVWDECARVSIDCMSHVSQRKDALTHAQTQSSNVCVPAENISRVIESRRERERVTAREQERESGTSSANLAQQLRRSRLNSNWTTDWRRAECVCACVCVECTVISHSRSC